ncbi:MAG TPA: hypothetical protein VNT99_01500, partial [Methylomirabilota bacterium]|nr:hypothetical protein [Methylomirabilota bacterium]
FEDKHWDLKWVLKEDPTVEQADGIVWWKDFLYDRHSLSKNEMEYRSELKSVLRVCASEALQDGFRIRACMFCAHFDSEANRCEKLREEVHLRRAINCPDYSETDWESSIDLEWY